MSRPSEWWASVRSRVQGSDEKGSATEGPVTREVEARAAMVVNTAAVLRSRGRGSVRGNGRGNGTSGSGFTGYRTQPVWFCTSTPCLSAPDE